MQWTQFHHGGGKRKPEKNIVQDLLAIILDFPLLSWSVVEGEQDVVSMEGKAFCFIFQRKAKTGKVSEKRCQYFFTFGTDHPRLFILARRPLIPWPVITIWAVLNEKAGPKTKQVLKCFCLQLRNTSHRFSVSFILSARECVKWGDGDPYCKL